MRRSVRILFILAFTPPVVAAGMGWLAGPSFLHPLRRELSPDVIKEADSAFAQIGTHREEFDVRAANDALLRGWKVRAVQPNGNWVLVFHGVADNRVGVVGQSEVLLRAGYNVVMMDARAHGASDGPMATYGWLERNDSKTVGCTREDGAHASPLCARRVDGSRDRIAIRCCGAAHRSGRR